MSGGFPQLGYLCRGEWVGGGLKQTGVMLHFLRHIGGVTPRGATPR